MFSAEITVRNPDSLVVEVLMICADSGSLPAVVVGSMVSPLLAAAVLVVSDRGVAIDTVCAR